MVWGGGAAALHTQACLDGRWGTTEQFSSLSSLPTLFCGESWLFEDRGYIVYKSDMKPVAVRGGTGPIPEGPSPPMSLLVPDHGRLSQRAGLERRSSASYKHFGESICPGAGNVAFRWMKRYIVDGLLKLLPVSCELLDAGFTLQVPQANRAVMTW